MEGGLSRRTTVETFVTRSRELGERAFLHFHRDGGWRHLSWNEARERVVRVAAALLAEGVATGDRVALISENSPEWILADFAIQMAGAVTVPLYPSLLPRTVAAIVEDSGAVVGLAGTEELAAKLREVPHLRRAFTMDRDVEGWFRREPAVWEAEAVRVRAGSLGRDDVATIVYTSGTTGESKGVVLLHRNLVDMVASSLEAFRYGRDDVLLAVLPYAHVLERVGGLQVSTCAGAEIWLSRGLDHLLDDLAEARPTAVIGVPRLFEKVFDRVMEQVAEQPGIRRSLFAWALRSGHRRVRATRPRAGAWLEHRLADRLVLAPLRRRLTGGRLRFFLSGGAPLSETVEDFYWSLGVPILQGWGMTELTSGAVVNTEEAHRFGTVGRPMPGVELRLAADGEILVRGLGVMREYFRRPEATAATFSDGWLCTGDIGTLDGDGFLRITDRKKDLLKTAGGKFVAPLPIEARLERERIVEWAVVLGDERPFVTALIVPDWAALHQLHGIAGEPERMVEDSRVRGLVQERIDALNRDLAGFETIKAFALLPCAFSEEADELTPTLKPKRRVIRQRYGAEIDAMYRSAWAAHRAG